MPHEGKLRCIEIERFMLDVSTDLSEIKALVTAHDKSEFAGNHVVHDMVVCFRLALLKVWSTNQELLCHLERGRDAKSQAQLRATEIRPWGIKPRNLH